MTSRCGNLLRSVSADACSSSADVIAFEGQEKVYQKVYNSMGLSNESLASYFGGPAFLAWNRGQGLQAWGGKMDEAGLPGQAARPWAKGLPQSWIDGQWRLQQEILPKMRAFGMTPVTTPS